MKHISRISRPRSGYGWLVRYNGRGKWFADGKYGGEKKSLIAARFFLSEQKRKYPKPRISSGVEGVIRSSIKSAGKEVPCFIVQFKQAGIFKRFYPHHYGGSEEIALSEAARFRYETARELERERARREEDARKAQASDNA